MRQNETSDRPGSVPLKVQSANQRRGSRGGQKQHVLSAAPERGRREDMEVFGSLYIYIEKQHICMLDKKRSAQRFFGNVITLWITMRFLR